MDDAARSDIDAIHAGTALYTSRPEIDALLAWLGWPGCGGTLLDPAAGDGNMLVAALEALAPAPGDARAALRIQGVEFHPDSAELARERLAAVLASLGWDGADARTTADGMVHRRDFLLDPPPGRWDAMVANPPYLRRVRLSARYRDLLDAAVPRHARGDLLHAYLHAMTNRLAEGGRVAAITSDRWLANDGAAALRHEVGRSLSVAEAERLHSASAFHRPKERTRGTPPRVHAVALLLAPEGRALGEDQFIVERTPEVDGVPLGDVVDIRLAPWLGPDGIFTVGAGSGLPGEHLVPCVEPRDIDARTGRIGPTRRWAIVTGSEPPPPSIARHLERHMHRMPARGRRRTPWQPPESFGGLPLRSRAVLVPRIARRLTAIPLPAGMLPSNHSLVAVSGRPAEHIVRMLEDERVQAQADLLAARIESGYRSYTATLLRRLVVPHDLVEDNQEEGKT